MKLMQNDRHVVGNQLIQSGDNGNPDYIDNILCQTKLNNPPPCSDIHQENWSQFLISRKSDEFKVRCFTSQVLFVYGEKVESMGDSKLFLPLLIHHV